MKAKFLKSFARRWCAVWLLFCAAFALVACKPESGQQGKDKKFLGLFTRESDMPDNGVRKLKINGTDYHYIPLKEAKFLIPDKTWLKGFSRMATDNSVYSITLHALPPNFEPWSQDKHKQMYGDGMSSSVVTVRIKNKEFDLESATSLPYGLRNHFSYEKIILPNDSSAELIRFREKKTGDDSNKYVYIENNLVKYNISCETYCNLLFLRNDAYMIDMHFHRGFLNQSVKMADKLQILLDQFEAEGERYAHLAEMTERGKVGVF